MDRVNEFVKDGNDALYVGRFATGFITKVEYASNDNTTINEDLTTAQAVNRENGSLGLRLNPTETYIRKALRFETPYNPNTDILTIEISANRTLWRPIELGIGGIGSAGAFITPLVALAGRYQGIGLHISNTNVISLTYGRFRFAPQPAHTTPALAISAGSEWSSITENWYWRVAKKTFGLAKEATDDVLKDSPHLWEVGKEYTFSDGSFGRRFTGTITAAANTRVQNTLQALSSTTTIIGQGGQWKSGNTGFAFPTAIFDGPVASTPPNTFAGLYNANGFLLLQTICVAARTASSYDIWIRYTKA